MVTKSKKNDPNTSSIEQIVKTMIEAGDLSEKGVFPENFDELDPINFVRAVGHYKAKALGTPAYRNKVTTYAWADASIANSLISKYEAAYTSLNGEEMEQALAGLRITLDYGVMSSDSTMVPRILPNGAILIRNNHRVIGLSESPDLRLSISSADLHKELSKVLASATIDGSPESRFDFLIIHRTPDGMVLATQNLPEELSSFGQSLIIIGRGLDLNGSDFLSNSGIDGVQESSRMGVAVLRSFHNISLVYSTERLTDDLDTIVEEYSKVSLDELEDAQTLVVGMSYQKLGRFVSERTAELIESTDLKRPTGLAGYFFDHIMTSNDNYESYSSEKRKQISCLRPFFGYSAVKPVHYYLDYDPYWDLSEVFEHHFAAVQIPMSLFENIKEFKDQFSKKVDQFFKAGNFPSNKSLLLIEDAKLAVKDDLVALTSAKAKKWVAEKAQELQDLWEESSNSYEDESELFQDNDINIVIGLVFKSMPDYAQLNICMRQSSEICDVDCNLSVPYIGFCQGYDSGDYDTGNSHELLTPDQLGD